MNEKQTVSTQSATSKSLASEAKNLSLRPTKKQKELLDYIQAFIDEHGYSPSSTWGTLLRVVTYASGITVPVHWR
jgi:SOS-response transcriptional repressor LexA